ncbi:hypothetical protein ACLBW0_09335 [Enterobacteriaceae bacterium C34A]
MNLVKLTSVISGVLIGFSLLSGSSIIDSPEFAFSKKFSDFIIIIFTLHAPVVVNKITTLVKNYLI